MPQTLPLNRRGSVPNSRSPLKSIESDNKNENSISDNINHTNNYMNKHVVMMNDGTTLFGKKDSDLELGVSTAAEKEAGEEERYKKQDVERRKKKKKKGSSYLITLSLIFFVSTILNNLVLEGASEIVASSPYEDALIGSASTLFQCASCFIVPILMDMVNRKNSSSACLRRMAIGMTLSDLRPYLQLTVAVMITSHCANLSVAYVSYPTKVVLKSAKLIPTMIVSTVFFRHSKKQRRHYTTKDYMAATCLCIGAAGYSYDPSKKHDLAHNDSTHQQYFGVILLTVSVIIDAFVPNLQQRLMSSTNPSTTGYSKKITASDLMINVNGIATIGIFIYMLLIEKSLIYVFYYSFTNTKYTIYMILNGFSQAIGIFAYTKVIQASGSVVAVAISTLRKVVTITLSYIVFPGKPFLTVHFISATMVVIGILLQSLWNRKIGKK